MKFPAVFSSAGLPPPALSLQVVVAAGPERPLYAHAAHLVRALSLTLERLGITSAGEADVDTLAARLLEKVVTSGGEVVWLSVIRAVGRKPTQA